jgi:2-polyprenyl-3-methyl-5-hydroxy-6-metoxy-1,4-benzoquinol methylase
MDLKEAALGVDPRTHWYYRTKRRPLDRYFDRVSASATAGLDVVDVGAGSGAFSEGLIDRFPSRIRNVIRVDLHYPEVGAAADPRLSAGTLEHRRDLPETIDHSVVLLMDVLEHVPDDRGFLGDVVGKCQGRNHVFITVPAFDFLWSGKDVFLGHYRRYSLSSLRSVVTACNVTITRAYYMFGLFLPAAYAARRLRPGNDSESDLQPAPGWLNALLVGAGVVDTSFCRWNRIGGITAVVEGTIDA